MYIGGGWSWLVRRAGKDLANGLAASAEQAGTARAW